MQYLKPAAFWLTIVGAVNWGLVGLLKLNLVTALLGEEGLPTTIVYLLVGVAGLYLASTYTTKQGKK